MSNPSGAKGARAEREIAGILADRIGVDVKRMLGAGRATDVGDLFGLEQFTAQVAFWPHNTLGALRAKPIACEIQQAHGNTPFGVSFLKLPPQPGGKPPEWRAVMTLEQFFEIYETLRLLWADPSYVDPQGLP